MQTFWLILGSVVLPLIWGWAMHRLLAWLWPERQLVAAARDEIVAHPDPLADYQI
jgi:hypothetical protein